MRASLLLLLALLLQPITLKAQQWNWAVDAGGGGNTDFCWGIATDSQGNAYWAGSVSGTADFGCGTLSPGNTIAGFVAKVDASGVCQWVRGITVGFNEAWAYGIAIDTEDRIYVTGSYDGNASFGNGITLNSLGGDDIFLARYDVDGNCLWARRGGSGGSNDEARGIAISDDGGVFITGISGGTTIGFDGISIPNAANFRQIIIAKYDSTGTVQWAKASAGTTQNKSARAIAVANGRLFITGQMSFTNASFDGIPLLPASNSIGFYALACDLDGNALWARSYVGGDHEGMDIGADTLGNVFLVGRMWGNLYLPDDTLASMSSNDDILIMGLDRDGNYRWAKSTGSSNRDLAWGVTPDGLGNAYIAAQFNNTINFFGSPFTSLGSEDILISKLDADGDVVWAQRPSGFQRDIPLCIHRQAEAPHKLYFGGYFWGAITYGSTTIDDVQNGDAMIVSGMDTTFDVTTYAPGICLGSCDGVAYAFANGVEPFTFLWNNGATTSSISGLCAGEQVVEVTDAEGNVEVDTVLVVGHEPISYSIQVEGDSLWIDGGSNWSWELDGFVVGAGQPYHIAWASGTYAVHYVDEHGCLSGSPTILVVLNVGSEETVQQRFGLWPNPVTGRATIEWNGGSPVQARLFNSAGQCLFSRMLFPGTNVFDLTGLDAGLYLLRTDEGKVMRMMKE